MARPRDDRQKDLLRPALEEIIDLGHPLVRLAREIDWGFLDGRFASVCAPGPGQPGLPTRLVAGLFILKHMHNLSDEALCARSLENPYYQFFCGELSFCHRLPFDRSSLTHWRQRLGEEQLMALIQESLAVAHKTGGPPSTLWGALRVRCCHSLEFGQDRHFLKVVDAEAHPVDAHRCSAWAPDADHVGRRRDYTEGLIGGVAGHGLDDLQIVHRRADRHGRVTEFAQDGEFQVSVASPLPQRRPSRVTATEPQTMASSPGMSTRATSSDQRSPRDKVAASLILSGGIRRGSSFLKPRRNLGVGTKTVTPRRSASARSGRCGESGLTLMAVALFQARCQGGVRPPVRHPRNSGSGRVAEMENAPRPQRHAYPRPTAARRACRRSPEP